MTNDFPTAARVVIIGGGVAGCSIAYHLALKGWNDVVVLDRGELTSGSTFHSAGLVGQLRSSVTLTKTMMYGCELYGKLAAETGQDPGWHAVGSLRLASSRDRMDELQRQTGWAQTFGLPMELVDAKRAQELFPLMDLKGVQGGVWLPTDGYLDPSNLAYTLATGARNRGVKFRTHSRVEKISIDRNHVGAVVTAQGTIRCEFVVNAAGIWANEIGRLVGIDVPVIPMAHQYLVTKPHRQVPKNLPQMRDPDLLVYFREEVGGLVMGGYERHPKPWGLDGIPIDFNHKLLSEDWDRFEEIMANAIRRVPFMEHAEISRFINGPEAFTPDGEFILGESDLRGFFVAAGFCAHGIAGAGGVGKLMAEWITEGEPSLDLWKMDIRRFGPQYGSQRFTLARVMEVYERYYDIHFPNEERLAARALRLPPTYERLQTLGAVFGEKSSWERPNWYQINEQKSDGTFVFEPLGWAAKNYSRAIEAEHLATREQAGLFEETSFSKLLVTGKDALAFLQRLTDNEMNRPIGSVTYTQMLNERGGTECDFTITRLASDRFQIVTGTAFGNHDLGWIRQHLPIDDSVNLEDITSSRCCLGLWGPRARDILSGVTQADLSNSAFPYMTSRRLAIGNVPVLAMRVTYVGEFGWELYAPMEYGVELWDTLWEAGERFGMVAAGYRAIESLRLEKGYRYWSADISPEYSPYEAGLGFCVKLEKGDFIGKKALLTQKEKGLSQRLCCIVLDDVADLGAQSPICFGGEPILHEGITVGRVTSGGYGYTVGKSIAYGYLPMGLSIIGTHLEIEIFGERLHARVVAEPLYDPKGVKIKL